MDQGITYLNLMLEYKAEFIVEYNECCHKDLKRNDIDWSQSKVIFVAPAFTDYQKQSTNFRDLAIELWEIKYFENNLLIINPIQKSKSAPNIKQIQQRPDSTLAKVTNQIVVYDEDYHLHNKSKETQELYEIFRDAILALSPILDTSPQKHYIAFKADKKIL